MSQKNADFLLTWDKSTDQLKDVLRISEELMRLRRANVSPRLFDSGLAVSVFRDNSTRTRFSFASACNLLGLAVQDLDEGKSQIAHGETVRETATMVSFMADVIGIRDDLYIGKGHAYMLEVAEAVQDAFDRGILDRRPGVVNLQCDLDHPTQSLADLQHLADRFGGLDALRGKKVAMSWAHSPSYGKPLSVPQGIISLFTRFGMDVVLAHPKGYGLMPETTENARRFTSESGGSFRMTDRMEDAFEQADIVYPKSWAPFEAMRRRTVLHDAGDFDGIRALETELLEENARHEAWTCTERLMASTRDGQALYMHCLPADITGVSCRSGEVEASVFARYRTELYRQAGFKPTVIAAMILAGRLEEPMAFLERCRGAANPRQAAIG